MKAVEKVKREEKKLSTSDKRAIESQAINDLMHFADVRNISKKKKKETNFLMFFFFF